MDQEVEISQLFVELADTLVDDYDVVDFLHTLCVQSVAVLGIDAGGVMLSDHRDRLQVLAASSEEMDLLELFQIQNNEGPCLECHRQGGQVVAETPGAIDSRWPRFGERVRGRFESVYAIPLRYRRHTIGGLNLFGRRPNALDRSTVQLAQALADVATIGLLQERAVREATVLNEQLQSALNTRVVIEQAKGKFVERHGGDLAAAFEALRSHSRNHNIPLRDVALAFLDDDLSFDRA